MAKKLTKDNDDIKKAEAIYYTQESYQALLQIEFNKDKVETLREISKTYVRTTNESDEEETKTVEIENPMAAERTFSITDANYEGLPITDGQITLTSE